MVCTVAEGAMVELRIKQEGKNGTRRLPPAGRATRLFRDDNKNEAIISRRRNEANRRKAGTSGHMRSIDSVSNHLLAEMKVEIFFRRRIIELLSVIHHILPATKFPSLSQVQAEGRQSD